MGTPRVRGCHDGFRCRGWRVSSAALALVLGLVALMRHFRGDTARELVAALHA